MKVEGEGVYGIMKRTVHRVQRFPESQGRGVLLRRLRLQFYQKRKK